jgi:DNA-directed RNA polymerase subunit RPC12/RpoP
MAVKTSCSYCKKSFSAPEEYRGKKVECPSCGRRFILRTEEDIHAVQEQVEAANKKREEVREKLALIEKIESRGPKKPGRPYYEEFQTGVDGVRHFNPRATSRFLRFRTFSDFLVLGAYLEILLVAVGIGLMIYLRISGLISSVSVLFALLVAWLILGAGLFLFFKYLGELAFLLAEVGDQQNDIVQLLLDLRVNTDPKETEA